MCTRYSTRVYVNSPVPCAQVNTIVAGWAPGRVFQKAGVQLTGVVRCKMRIAWFGVLKIMTSRLLPGCTRNILTGYIVTWW